MYSTCGLHIVDQTRSLSTAPPVHSPEQAPLYSYPAHEEKRHPRKYHGFPKINEDVNMVPQNRLLVWVSILSKHGLVNQLSNSSSHWRIQNVTLCSPLEESYRRMCPISASELLRKRMDSMQGRRIQPRRIVKAISRQLTVLPTGHCRGFSLATGNIDWSTAEALGGNFPRRNTK